METCEVVTAGFGIGIQLGLTTGIIVGASVAFGLSAILWWMTRD